MFLTLENLHLLAQYGWGNSMLDLRSACMFVRVRACVHRQRLQLHGRSLHFIPNLQRLHPVKTVYSIGQSQKYVELVIGAIGFDYYSQFQNCRDYGGLNNFIWSQLFTVNGQNQGSIHLIIAGYRLAPISYGSQLQKHVVSVIYCGQLRLLVSKK